MRNFPRQWRAIEEPGSSWRVVDAKGQILCYLYYDHEYFRRNHMKLLTGDEAREIAASIAQLPELIAYSSE